VNFSIESSVLQSSNGPQISTTSMFPPYNDLLQLSKPELVCVAQLVCEQAVSSTSAISTTLTIVKDDLPIITNESRNEYQAFFDAVLAKIFPNFEQCSIGKLALIREPPPRQIPQSGKTPQPRPPQREGNMHLGPDCFSLPAPYMRVQRGTDAWEMLPPAVSFWTALGLGPANGAKDVTAIFISPSNDDLIEGLRGFMQELASTYESYKLGGFRLSPVIDTENQEGLHYEDGVVHVELDQSLDSIGTMISTYYSTCQRLGSAISRYSRAHPERTLVICIIDPFEDVRATRFFCACFWRLFTSCRQSTPKTHQKAPRSDIVLQILPVSLLASPQQLVLLDGEQLGVLAKEIYDRCPPSQVSSVIDPNSTLSILAAPAVEVATTLPKRIAFQPVSDPPSDLLLEGSVLHLAYTLSADLQWMSVCWIDGTGRHYVPTTICLRGKSFKIVAGEVWERTLEIISAREVTWRIFIVSSAGVDAGVKSCWKSLAAAHLKKQVLHVTLLSTQDDPLLHLTPLESADIANLTIPGQVGGFFSPAATPTGMTVSPDANGQTTTVPQTPVSTDNAPPVSENDPDAQLVDTSDESWGVLLSPAFTNHQSASDRNASSDSSDKPLAEGVLFRRGSQDPNESSALQSLGVSLHWDIRIRPGANVDEGPVRQAEVTLREVLRMYRNLALLSRLKGLDGSNTSTRRGNSKLLPLHILSAMRGADALKDYL
jgi:mediator of RNA polymerase II transcription subunit 13, fungi type